MPRDGADHHDLGGVCQGNRCGRESAEYIVESSANLTPTRERATEPDSRAVLRMPFGGNRIRTIGPAAKESRFDSRDIAFPSNGSDPANNP
jgi:hypothetical protein